MTSAVESEPYGVPVSEPTHAPDRSSLVGWIITTIGISFVLLAASIVAVDMAIQRNPPDPVFQYGDEVVVVSGFFEGQAGTVVQPLMIRSRLSRPTWEYLISAGNLNYHWVAESELGNLNGEGQANQ